MVSVGSLNFANILLVLGRDGELLNATRAASLMKRRWVWVLLALLEASLDVHAFGSSFTASARSRRAETRLSDSAAAGTTTPGSSYVGFVQSKLRAGIPGVVHCHVRDCSDGHTVTGFSDGSKRALAKDGIQLEVLIVASAFEGVSTMKRHRTVHACLDEEFKRNAIHSLELKTLTAEQWEGMGGPPTYAAMAASQRQAAFKIENS